MLRFVVDESTGQVVVGALRSAGFDVLGIGELMPQASDAQVIEFAAQSERVLITNDKDFGEKVFRGGHRHAGVLLLRLGDERADTKIRVVMAVLKAHAPLLPGHFTVATERSVRVRRDGSLSASAHALEIIEPEL